MISLPLSQQQALLAGSPLYYTGRPCKYGHVSNRRTDSGSCVGCYESRRDCVRKLKPSLMWQPAVPPIPLSKQFDGDQLMRMNSLVRAFAPAILAASENVNINRVELGLLAELAVVLANQRVTASDVTSAVAAYFGGAR